MVKHSTAVQCSPLPELSYTDSLVVLGSCFSRAMGDRLARAKFDALVNPHGTLFNPSSIANTIRAALDCAIPDVGTFELSHGVYVNVRYHSQLARATVEESQEAIASANEKLVEYLERARGLVVTFGSAWVYRLPDGSAATNCHRMPADRFRRELLDVGDIVSEWMQLVAKLRERNPGLRLLFTVSPVRHLNDGLRENAVSKATLLLAVHNLVRALPEAYYFPAYEILQDELRDYRYYADDLVHPSSLAEELIWERLQETWLSPATRTLVARHERIAKALAHRTDNLSDPAYQHQLGVLLAEIESLEQTGFAFDYTEEKARISGLRKS